MGTYRANNREIAIKTIKENLQHSIIDDRLWQTILGWFERTQKEDIPASSILELYCVAQNYKSLLCLAFQLYVKCNNEEERDILKEKLKSFSNDLAFQWYWLQPYLQDVLLNINSFMGENPRSSAIQEIYIKWSMNQNGEEMMKYLEALSDEERYTKNIGQCIEDVIRSFTNWLSDLCISSMIEAYDTDSQEITLSLAETIIKTPEECTFIEKGNNGYIESNQDNLGKEVGIFFNNFIEQWKTGNELWFYERVNAVVAHLRKDIDLFSTKEEIRRSIIFCSKSSNYHFVITLNNKLSH